LPDVDTAPQQPDDNWMGGHLTEPYEQKTQAALLTGRPRSLTG